MSEVLVASGNNKSAERINRNKRPAAAPIEVADRNALWWRSPEEATPSLVGFPKGQSPFGRAKRETCLGYLFLERRVLMAAMP